jgi:drug/metabolite transporter (DMT)-like permease
MSVSADHLAGISLARRARLGLVLTLCCSIAYATLPTLARLAYDGGADPMAVMMLRSSAAAILYLCLCQARHLPLMPPRGLRWAAVLVGLVWVIGAYCYVSSYNYIPIGLAVTIFYLFPLLVAVVARLFEGERMAPMRLIALIVGFSGVALAVGTSFGAIAPIGVALAFVSAIGLTINITVNARVMRRASPFTAMAAMTGTGVLAMLAVVPFVGIAWPVTPLGWFGAIAGAAIFCLANSFFYIAISLIGTVRAAMICNLEPVAATFFAFLILGEALGPLQLAGIALVIGAIILMQLGGRVPR